MLTRKAIIAVTAIGLLLSFSPAFAFQFSPYLFANAGVAEPDLGRLNDEYNAIANQAARNGGEATFGVDERGFSSALGIGVQLHQYFALEVSYHHLGSYDIEASGNFSDRQGSITTRGDAQAKIRGWGVQGILLVPISRRLVGTLSAGAIEIKTEINGSYAYDLSSPLYSETDTEYYDQTFTDTVGHFSLGARYAINEDVFLQMDYSYIGGGRRTLRSQREH